MNCFGYLLLCNRPTLNLVAWSEYHLIYSQEVWDKDSIKAHQAQLEWLRDWSWKILKASLLIGLPHLNCSEGGLRCSCLLTCLHLAPPWGLGFPLNGSMVLREDVLIGSNQRYQYCSCVFCRTSFGRHAVSTPFQSIGCKWVTKTSLDRRWG